MKLRKLATVILLVAASFTTAFTVGTVTASQASASVAASSHTKLWWDGTTCRAFGAGRIHAMVTDSRHADTYLRVDVALWAHDGKRHASRVTLELDRSFVLADCTLTGDQ
jgi:hypothetical protein